MDAQSNLKAIEKVLNTHQESYVLTIDGKVQFFNPAALLLLSRYENDIRKEGIQTLNKHKRFALQAIPIQIGAIAAELVHIRDRNIRSALDTLKKHLSDYDLLSGLINDKTLEKLTISAMRRANRVHAKIAMIQIDCLDERQTDYLDDIDQQDARLIQLCQKSLRDTDILARLNPNAFAVLVEDLRVSADAAQVAEKLIASLIVPENWPNKCPPKIKIGIVVYPDAGVTYEDLMHNLKVATSTAPMGRHAFYIPRMGDQEKHLMAIDTHLRRALAKNEFTLNYQPILSLKTHKIIALEALLRWHNPILGNISPSTFVPRLEASGGINAVGKWVISESARQFRNANLDPEVRLSINVSPLQLMDDGFVDAFLTTTKKQLKLSDIILEVTETYNMNDNLVIEKNLHRLHKKGICLSIDDFGAGYTSLKALNELPYQIMKLDKAYVDDMQVDTPKAQKVQHLVLFAKACGMKVVAEGVRSQEQADILKSYQCDAIQGEWLSTPKDIVEMATFVRNWKA